MQESVVDVETLELLTATEVDVLGLFNVKGHWSGRGQRVEFGRKEELPLKAGMSLGEGRARGKRGCG
jgi:hypothetical protein